MNKAASVVGIRTERKQLEVKIIENCVLSEDSTVGKSETDQIALLNSNHACMRISKVLRREFFEKYWQVFRKVIFQGAALLVSLESGRSHDDVTSIFYKERTCLMLDSVQQLVVFVNPIVVVIDLVTFEGAILELEQLISAKS